jgi:hypothetical protein
LNHKAESGIENVPLPFAGKNDTGNHINAKERTKAFWTAIAPPGPDQKQVAEYRWSIMKTANFEHWYRSSAQSRGIPRATLQPYATP